MGSLYENGAAIVLQQIADEELLRLKHGILEDQANNDVQQFGKASANVAKLIDDK